MLLLCYFASLQIIESKTAKRDLTDDYSSIVAHKKIKHRIRSHYALGVAVLYNYVVSK